MHFPEDMDPEYFDKVFRLQPAFWKPAFEQIARVKNLPVHEFYPFKDGSNLIASFGDRILKVFPPFLRHQWTSEYRVMQHLDGTMSLPIPRFLEAGAWPEGWTFIIMSRLPGTTLEKIWPDLSPGSKVKIMHDIGAIMRQVHAIPVSGLADLPPLWNDFFPKQIHACRLRHERLGMPAWFLDRVDDFVQESLDLLPKDFSPVILTGEYTPFNLLVDDSSNADRIAGMIDFGDAMIGYSDYDFLGPLMFLGEGNPLYIQALFSGYGFTGEQLTPMLRRRLFLLQILHRYSDFYAQMRVPAWESRVGSLEELEQLIWPLSL